MPFENPNAYETNKKPLELFFNNMSDDERNIIEGELFNYSDIIPLETALDVITDEEEARAVLRQFREYIDTREILNNADRAQFRLELNDYIDRRLH